jgi:hypothetical protein
MEATQTDLENPQLTSQEDGTVDGIAGGIMDLLDGDPNQAGTVTNKPAETPATEPEAEPETGTAESADEPDKFIIKWQGQDKEVTQSELIDLAQKGFDYTQKTQAVSEKERELSPYIGLANLIKSDPTKANQIAAILTGQQAPQPQPEKKTFDDPIEQLKWETKQDILAEVRREQQAALIPLHRQQALNQVKAQVQADPDFKEVHQAIIDMVKGQPPTIQKALFLQLDQDPAAYVEAFQHFKNQKATKPTTTTPTPVKKETRAPILEAGGVESPTGIEGKAKAERISKMKAKAMRSGEPTAVADWLKASGAIEHLY